MPETRRGELERSLRGVQQRIASAADAAGRSPDDVTLIVVTKTWPTSDVRILYDLGVRHVVENRHQDAEPKALELTDLGLSWHFVGQVQSNKAARIATYADAVHSVDSVRVATRLGDAARQQRRRVDCFIQVSLDSGPPLSGRGGVDADGVEAVANAVDQSDALRLRGVMGVAPLRGDPRAAYAELARISATLRTSHPGASAISGGMSGDFVAAIGEGATHVRVGSAVLGERPALR